MVSNKSATAVSFFGCDAAAGTQVVQQIEKRLVTFRQVTHLSGPVIHLNINVNVIVGVVGRVQTVYPLAPQVNGHRTGARAADEQVSAKLKIQGNKLWILSALLERLQALVGWHVGCLGFRQIQLDSSKKSLMLGNMCLTKFGIAFSCDGFQLFCTKIMWIVATIICSSNQSQSHGVCIFNTNALFNLT